VLNARNAFAPLRAPQQTKNYSGYFNGPIILNRWDFLAYAGVWQQDDNSIVNAVILTPGAFLAQPFTTTTIAPTRNTDFSINSNLLLTNKQTLGFGYSYSGGKTKNQGLQGGFDLPERAYRTASRNDALRFALTSIPSKYLLNQLRVQLRRYRFDAQALDPSSAILVFGAFNAGGNQGSLFSLISNKSLQVVDLLSYTRKAHTLKVGFRADVVYLRNVNRSNYNGTFTFGTDFERDASGNLLLGANQSPIIITPLEHYRRTLLRLPGYRPSQFSIVFGDPAFNLSQREMSWFIQDDWRVSNRLLLSYGLRHEFQTNLRDKINFAPRVGLAWAADKNRKAVVRFGAGIFYNNIDTNITANMSSEKAKWIREREAESVAEFLGVADISFLRFPDGYLSVCIPEAAEVLKRIVMADRPQQIYLPHEYEAHPDHAMTSLILKRALGSVRDNRPLLIAYEVWTPLYHYNHVENISTTMGRKLRAIRRYRSQNISHRFDRSCRELNRYRGYLAFRNSYAEVFQYEGEPYR
jgi:hypothetical protein